MSKPKFYELFTRPLYRQNTIFELFQLSIGKVLAYFFILNLVMFIPLTFSVLNMEMDDYSYYGFDFHENLPDWLPSELPDDCEIVNQALECESDEVYTYTIVDRETLYLIYLNVDDQSTEYTKENTFVFKRTYFEINLENDNQFVLSYTGFSYTNFEDLKTLPQEEAAQVLFDGIFESLRPFVVMPLMLYSVGGLILGNLILVLVFASLSMLFKLTITGFPRYQNMIKLFIIASTIPSLINLVLGFFGLSAFTSIPYNFLTPLFAFVLYRKNTIHTK